MQFLHLPLAKMKDICYYGCNSEKEKTGRYIHEQ